MGREGKITEINRICGKCWEEDRVIIPLYTYEGDKITTHNHKAMKIKKGILEALEDKNEE